MPTRLPITKTKLNHIHPRLTTPTLPVQNLLQKSPCSSRTCDACEVYAEAIKPLDLSELRAGLYDAGITAAGFFAVGLAAAEGVEMRGAERGGGGHGAGVLG